MPTYVPGAGASGFIEISVDLSGDQLSDPASIYQAVVTLNNPTGITVGSPLEGIGADIHNLPPEFIGVPSTTQFIVGELSIPVGIAIASTSLFRLPYAIDPGATGDFTFAVVADAPFGSSQSSWNGSTAGLDFSGASTTVSAVPEPTSLAICGLVCAGVVARQRRKAKNNRSRTV